MTMVRLETMNAAGTAIASVEETSYEYDTGGTRIASVHKIDSTNDGTFETIRRTEYLTDHANPTGYSQVIMETETDANGNPIKRTVYTIGHDQISQTVYGPGTGGATWDSGTTHFFGTDGHGSVRVLYDSLAAVVTSAASVLQIFHYDAYGNLLNMAATSALTSYLYSGEAFDTRINHQYLRARWYDPATGRFTSLDPFRGNTSDPQSLHKYLYVHGDPINGIDPSGMFGFTAGFSGSIIGSMLNQATAYAGEGVLESLRQNRFAWEVAAFGALFTLLPIFGMAIGKFFGSAFMRSAAGRLIGIADEYLTQITGIARETIELFGRKAPFVPTPSVALNNVKGVLNAMKSANAEVKVVAQLYVDGSMWTGINNWAKGGARAGARNGDDTARAIANELGVIRESTTKVPWGPFLNHAEGHTLIQAAADGLGQGKTGYLFVSEVPCRMCRRNFSGMKEILKLAELEVWYLDELGEAQLWRKY